MKKWIFVWGLSCLLTSSGCCAKKAVAINELLTAEVMDTVNTNSMKDVSPSTLIIFYETTVGKKPLMKAVKLKHCTLLYNYKNMNGIAISIPKKWSINSAIRYFNQVKGVLQVNRDRICHLD